MKILAFILLLQLLANIADCQLEKAGAPCLTYPEAPLNSQRNCRYSVCTITCIADHQFPDGSTETTMTCDDGEWIPDNEEWINGIPDCEKSCNPECENGGSCLSYDICQCTQDFRGPQCQYPANVCNAELLNFNGNYECQGDMDSFDCTISCPTDIDFEFEPEESYSCKYDEGSFENIPKCVYDDSVEVVVTSRESYNYLTIKNITVIHNGENHTVSLAEYIKVETRTVVTESKNIQPSVCFAWGDGNIKTFDGKIISASTDCEEILVEDVVDGTFSVSVVKSENKQHRIINVKVNSEEYVISKSIYGEIILLTKNKEISIPVELNLIKLYMEHSMVIAEIKEIGVVIRWDTEQLVQVEVTDQLWKNTGGLCGFLDGNPDNDICNVAGDPVETLTEFLQAWRVNEACNIFNEVHACKGLDQKQQDAEQFCMLIISNDKFYDCWPTIELPELFQACTWDYCACTEANACACESLSMFAKNCYFEGGTNETVWRDPEVCPMKCTNGKEYMLCEPEYDIPTCGTTSIPAIASRTKNSECHDGCYCPEGTYLHNDACIPKSDCPCSWAGEEYAPNSEIQNDCNTCTCSEGEWKCTKKTCCSTCSANGDPHYVTLDGKKFDFMGLCNYYLLKLDGLSVEQENIQRTPNSPVTFTNAIIVKLNRQKIYLKQRKVVEVNGEVITEFPHYVRGAKILVYSSAFIAVEVNNGVEVLWNGDFLVYVNVPPTLKGRTKGLCGTYNGNTNDDFLTPDSEIETNPTAFGNMWKTGDRCITDAPDPVDPCEAKENKEFAELHCGVLKTELFKSCHKHVEVEQFYQDCLYDMCACYPQVECLCSMIGAYGKECSKNGIQIDWEAQVEGCAVACGPGQVLQQCGNPCTRTCGDISRGDCREQCVEGCNCPEGQTLSGDACIPISQCKCINNGLEFDPGYKEVRKNETEYDLCTCESAIWNCIPATEEDIQNYPEAEGECDSTKNFVYTNCLLSEPKTCKNIGEDIPLNSGKCTPGCECKEGYVLDLMKSECVKPTECTCHSGGQSYPQNTTVDGYCKSCTCNNAKWDCIDTPCLGECSHWGDLHFQTFDNKIYDFLGQCNHIFAKGEIATESFTVTMKNVVCDDLETICSKIIEININSGSETEKLLLETMRPIDNDKNKLITMRVVDYLVVIEVPTFGLVMHWDYMNIFKFKVDSQWKENVKGLCGNYNNNEADDFQLQNSELIEISASAFVNSWKTEPTCRESLVFADACEIQENYDWAAKECEFLKSVVFESCHSKVPFESYYRRCITDSCACGLKGNCPSFCNAISSYTHECVKQGIAVDWRSEEICPMKCKNNLHYSPCVSTCALQTCDNLSYPNELCGMDVCIESCQPEPCPEDYVYSNSSYTECIPQLLCKQKCKEVENIIFYEGDVMVQDDCHSCFCSKGNEICRGLPCDEQIINVENHQGETETCVPGWSSWMANKRNNTIFENYDGKGVCDYDKMVDIECRTIITHIDSKDTGFDIVCSLDRGLVCESKDSNQPCPEFEIRMLCQCADPVEPSPEDPTCPEGEIWDNCAIQCDSLCSRYSNALKDAGFCKNTLCEGACVAADRPYTCPTGMLWANNEICVLPEDCMCASHNGDELKPGATHKESDCMSCQCINNYYECDTSLCQEEQFISTSEIPENVTIIKPPQSTEKYDPMGIDSGDLDEQQITVSSEFGPNNTKTDIKISGVNGWRPSMNSPNEWIEFNFLEQRRISGIVTMGANGGWISKFVVKYSHNGNDWLPILDTNLKETIFFGNYDEGTPNTIIFETPILATYLKFSPINWHKNIELRLEIYGTYQPYPEINENGDEEKGEEEEGEEGEEEGDLSALCPNIPNFGGEVNCTENLYWDGTACVELSDCPCVIENTRYSVGSVFEGGDCSTCICTMGGSAQCTTQICEKCEAGQQSTLDSHCNCKCSPCEDGYRLCQSSNVCIKATSWCDGVSECTDDELYCTTPNIVPSTPWTSEAKQNCKLEPKIEADTVGVIVAQKEPHGLCQNLEALENFPECQGTCQSTTAYNPMNGAHESECSCCRANKYEARLVELTCEDGHTFMKQIVVPSSCRCEGCSSGDDARSRFYQAIKYAKVY